MSLQRLLALVAVSMAPIAGPAAAATEPASVFQDEEKGMGDIPRAGGLGVGLQSEPYRAIDPETRIIPAPILLINEGRFSLEGLTASYRVFNQGNWRAAAMLDYRFQGYDSDDSPVLEGMEDRNGTLEAGGWIAYSIDDLNLTAYAQHDILSTHDGFELRARAAYNIRPFRATQITPFIDIAWQSEDLADYYYGVREDEAVASIAIPDADPIERFAYAPGETLTPAVGIQARQALSRRWIVVFSARHEFLPDEVVDSPIVEREGRTRIGGGLARIF